MRLIDADLMQGAILATKNQVKNHADKVVCDYVLKMINMTPTAESNELAQQLTAMKRERDAAVGDLEYLLRITETALCCDLCEKKDCFVKIGDDDGTVCKPKWRGAAEEGEGE